MDSKYSVNEGRFPFSEQDHPFRWTVEPKKGALAPIVIHVPIEKMTQQPKSFRDFKRPRDERITQLAIVTLSHLVQNLDLCDTSKDEQGNPNPSPNHVKADEEDKPWHRVQMFLEYVRRAGRPDITEAIRVWIIPCDASINFGHGILELIRRNALEAIDAKKRRRGPEVIEAHEGYRKVVDVSVWSDQVCDGYISESKCAFDDLAVFNPKKDITCPENPASPHKAFGIRMTFEKFKTPSAAPDQFNIEKYWDRKTKEVRFPDADSVFRLKRLFFHPKLLLRVNFPVRIENSAETWGRGFNEDILTTIRLRDMIEDEEVKRKSDIHVLASKNANLASKARGTPMEWLEYRERALDAFSKTWHVDSNPSAMCRNMIYWFKDRVDRHEVRRLVPTLSTRTRLYDAGLSVFANHIIGRFMAYEDYLLCSTPHRELFILHVFVMDAYRHKFDLHNNVLMTGAGATSKSFTIEQVEKMMIPGTTLCITHQTAKADAIAEDQNDVINLFHEMPAALLGIDAQHGGADTGDHIMKDKLTSQKVNSKVFHRDDDTGKRGNRHETSEQIGTIAGGTNEAASRMPEALRSRFMILPYNKMDRPGKSITESRPPRTCPSPSRRRRRPFLILPWWSSTWCASWRSSSGPASSATWTCPLPTTFSPGAWTTSRSTAWSCTTGPATFSASRTRRGPSPS
jgi:hypothetical protein